MTIRLNEVIPWGRSFEEYRRMFALTDEDLAGRTLGCGDGPATRSSQRLQFPDELRTLAAAAGPLWDTVRADVRGGARDQ